MFRSLARAWGAGAIAVVLSGALDDGAAGAFAVGQSGGRVIVQDPGDALVPGMPESALAVTTAPEVASVAAIAALLARLPRAAVVPTDRAERGRPNDPESGVSCPECKGALWELRDGESTRYRCAAGHSYSEEAMVAAQGTTVEAALWAALEVLEERSALLSRIACRMEDRPRTHERFADGAREASERAATIRRILHHGTEVTG
jgi:two-component system chemotaxis response regulator CheB